MQLWIQQKKKKPIALHDKKKNGPLRSNYDV